MPLISRESGRNARGAVYCDAMPDRPEITDPSVGLLTPRERECLRLVDQHLSSKQIARELGMSKTSVDTYCDRARRKLGVPDRYEAARMLRQSDERLQIGRAHA